MKIIIFLMWLSPLAKYIFSYYSMKINPVFIEKKLEYRLFSAAFYGHTVILNKKLLMTIISVCHSV